MKYTIFAYTLLVLLLAGCSANEENPSTDLKDLPIQVNVSVAELTTRAGYDNADNMPENFYLTVTNPNNEKYGYNVRMQKKDGQWDSYSLFNAEETLTMYWANGTTAVKVKAATVTTQESYADFSVNTDQSTAEKLKESDHLVMATKEVTPSKAGISVELSHAMAKINMSVVLGNEFNSDSNPLTNIVIGGTCTNSQFYFDSSTWSMEAGTSAQEITPLETSYTPIAGADAPNAVANYEVVLIPQTVAANGFYVSFTLGGRNYKWATTADLTFESGIQYTFQLKAGKDKVEESALVATQWSMTAPSDMEAMR